MKTASFATAAALLSTSYAATVVLETTQCFASNVPLQHVEIELNTSGPVATGKSSLWSLIRHRLIEVDLQQVCGLRIVESDVDVNAISCQAFKDVAGTQPGSAVFTYAQPASIATNPVQENAILCTYPTGGNKMRRQDNGTASGSISLGPIPTIISTVTLPDSSSSAGQSTITSTMVVTASSGMPSSSGNSTTPSMTQRPSASQTTEAPKESTGAASSGAVGMGMVAAAIAAMLV